MLIIHGNEAREFPKKSVSLSWYLGYIFDVAFITNVSYQESMKYV